MNICYDELQKCLDFYDIWPWTLTLRAIFVVRRKKIAYNLKTAGQITM